MDIISDGFHQSAVEEKVIYWTRTRTLEEFLFSVYFVVVLLMDFLPLPTP